MCTYNAKVVMDIIRWKGCEVSMVHRNMARGCLLTDNEDADEANYAELHVVIVKENIGKMCCKKSINPTAGAYEVNVCIKHRRA